MSSRKHEHELVSLHDDDDESIDLALDDRRMFQSQASSSSSMSSSSRRNHKSDDEFGSHMDPDAEIDHFREAPHHPWYRRPLPLALSCLLVLFITTIIFLSAVSDRYPSDEDGPAANQQTIQQSPYDTRAYRVVKLSNGLEAVLVSDSTTDLAAAALAVAVGSNADPTHTQGLAHFLEHMLFQGNAKYNDSSEYNKFIEMNGGHTNAFTANEETVYFFDIPSASLELALSRFSAFFISPLFLQSQLDKEMVNVDSEHQKNKLQDLWRNDRVRRACANPQSLFSKFGTGTISTLNQSNIRDQLISFRTQYYITPRMKLTIIGKEPLDDLQALAMTYFSDVPTGDPTAALAPLINTSIPLPFSAPFNSQYISIKSIAHSSILNLQFQLPPIQDLYLANPLSLISYLTGHEGAGSILHYLKPLDLVLSVSASFDSFHAFSLFSLEIRLAAGGAENTQKRHSVITTVFQYLQLMKNDLQLNKGLVVEKKWKEMIQLYTNKFLFQEKQKPINFAPSLAQKLLYIPPTDILLDPERFKVDLDSLQTFLKQMTPDNLIITYSSPRVTLNATIVSISIDPWYNASYHVENIANDLKQTWTFNQTSQLPDTLFLPRDNPFAVSTSELKIPIDTLNQATQLFFDNFTDMTYPTQLLWNDTKHNEHISIIQTLDKANITFFDSLSNVFWMGDTQFNLPYAFASIDIKSQQFRGADQLANQALGLVFAAVLNDLFNPIAYEGGLAGIDHAFQVTPLGFRLKFNGFSSSKFGSFLSSFFTLMTTRLPIGDGTFVERVERITAALSQDFDNFHFDLPYRHAMFYSSLLQEQNKFSVEELKAAVDNVDAGRLHQFTLDFFDAPLFVQAFFSGNLLRNDTFNIMNDLITKLEEFSPEPLSVLPSPHNPAFPYHHLYQVPVGNGTLYQRRETEGLNVLEADSALVLSLQVTPYSTAKAEEYDTVVRTNLLLELLALYIAPFCFSTLRTDQTLGYIVSCRSDVKNLNLHNFEVIIQSHAYSPEEIEERVEKFFTDFFKTNLPQFDTETPTDSTLKIWNGLVSTLTHQKTDPLQRMVDVHNRYWAHVSGNDQDWKRELKEVILLTNIKPKELVQFYQKYFLPSSTTRRKFSVEIFGSSARIENPTLPLPSKNGAAPQFVISSETLNTKGDRDRARADWKAWDPTLPITTASTA